MELARPLGLLHPEAAPLSVLFGHFLSHERKCPAGGGPPPGESGASEKVAPPSRRERREIFLNRGLQSPGRRGKIPMLCMVRKE